MDKNQIPELTELTTGEIFRAYKVTGVAGMLMPEHHSTKEAVVNVQKGSAILCLGSEEHKLEPGSVFIIPAKQRHSLSIKTDFNAIVIMEKESKIEF